MTSSPKPLESATITTVAWVQTLYPGILNLSYCTHPIRHSSPLILQQGGCLCPPCCLLFCQKPLQAAQDPHAPTSLPRVTVHSSRVRTQASWTTWTPTPWSKLGHRKMISGGGRCKDETLENFTAMRRKRSQHVKSGDGKSSWGYLHFWGSDTSLPFLGFCRFVCLLALGWRVCCYLQQKEERNVLFVPHLPPAPAPNTEPGTY